MVLKHLPAVGDGLHTDVAPGLTLNVLVLWVLTGLGSKG
jgi:ribonucleotide monophosphatase NagD (HAD superfamily)